MFEQLEKLPECSLADLVQNNQRVKYIVGKFVFKAFGLSSGSWQFTLSKLNSTPKTNNYASIHMSQPRLINFLRNLDLEEITKQAQDVEDLRGFLGNLYREFSRKA